MSVNNTSSKLKIISIYLTTNIIGILLIFFSVYNSSLDLETIDEINHLYNSTTSRLNQIITDNQKTFQTIDNVTLAKHLDNREYRVKPYRDNELYKIDECEISMPELNNSRIDSHGGFIFNETCQIIWSLIPVPQTQQYLLATHIFQSRGNAALFAVYKNKLIIPAIFFIWMTIWGSLILNNLITQIQRQKESAEHMARHDVLTGLPNRHLFIEKLNELIHFSQHNNQTLYIVVIDLNKFKEINDTYGHDAGDELLVKVADRFKKTIRNYDFAARIGGDEFVLVLPDMHNECYLTILHRIHKILIEPYDISDQVLTIGASLGISEYPKHSEDINKLIHKADMAMYSAKRQGGGIKIYEESDD